MIILRLFSRLTHITTGGDEIPAFRSHCISSDGRAGRRVQSIVPSAPPDPVRRTRNTTTTTAERAYRYCARTVGPVIIFFITNWSVHNNIATDECSETIVSSVLLFFFDFIVSVNVRMHWSPGTGLPPFICASPCRHGRLSEKVRRQDHRRRERRGRGERWETHLVTQLTQCRRQTHKSIYHLIYVVISRSRTVGSVRRSCDAADARWCRGKTGARDQKKNHLKKIQEKRSVVSLAMRLNSSIHLVTVTIYCFLRLSHKFRLRTKYNTFTVKTPSSTNMKYLKLFNTFILVSTGRYSYYHFNRSSLLITLSSIQKSFLTRMSSQSMGKFYN